MDIQAVDLEIVETEDLQPMCHLLETIETQEMQPSCHQ
jgi:hypothetical protein